MKNSSTAGRPPRRVGRIWAAVATLVVSAAFTGITAQEASAVTCSSGDAYTWSSSKTFAPGAWCVSGYYGSLRFNSNGALYLYPASGSSIWNSGTANKGTEELTLSMRGLASIRLWESSYYKWASIWTSRQQAVTSVSWGKFIIQIGYGSYSSKACFTISGYDSKTGGWINSGLVFPSSAGQCYGTYEMSGGSPGGDWGIV